MRVHEIKKPYGLFVDDVKGGVEVACSQCGETTTSICDISVQNKPLICQGCKKELFYRPWFEW